MLTDAREVPDQIQYALEAVRTIEKCQILDSWKWYEHQGVWALRFQLDIGNSKNKSIQSVSEWYVLVTDRYPLGHIRAMPAVEHGLTATFQHQRLNVSRSDLPWTAGEICTDIPGFLLERLVSTNEPTNSAERLGWHVHRAREWVKAAAIDDLVRPGEHFELPDFCIDLRLTGKFAFSEGADSIVKWASVNKKSGLVKLLSFKRSTFERIMPTEFLDKKGRTLIDIRWGKHSLGGIATTGGWVLLPNIPILQPWQVPMTWGQTT